MMKVSSMIVLGAVAVNAFSHHRHHHHRRRGCAIKAGGATADETKCTAASAETDCNAVVAADTTTKLCDWTADAPASGASAGASASGAGAAAAAKTCQALDSANASKCVATVEADCLAVVTEGTTTKLCKFAAKPAAAASGAAAEEAKAVAGEIESAAEKLLKDSPLPVTPGTGVKPDRVLKTISGDPKQTARLVTAAGGTDKQIASAAAATGIFAACGILLIVLFPVFLVFCACHIYICWVGGYRLFRPLSELEGTGCAKDGCCGFVYPICEAFDAAPGGFKLKRESSCESFLLCCCCNWISHKIWKCLPFPGLCQARATRVTSTAIGVKGVSVVKDAEALLDLDEDWLDRNVAVAGRLAKDLIV